ncbi:MAG TPA: glycosyl hydrolase 115 family protein [Bacteroidales bacterium]|nr:glycosyl hydrolase 115 family protein [Bacteroidales bacterium]
MSSTTRIKRTVLPARILSLYFILLITIPLYSNPDDSGFIRLKKNNFRIVFSNNEPEPLKIALEALKRDFSMVMGEVPAIIEISDKTNLIPEIVIVNRFSGALDIPLRKDKELDGFESHRVYADKVTNKIYLEGNDTRGTIYAIYTFSERFLGVPPLHYWSSWVPERKDEVIVSGGCDIFFKSPQVRYRSILSGDQDFLTPWLKLSSENENIWLETVLRLKLNTVECYSTIKPGYRLTDYAYLINKYGLVITSHHTSGLNTSFGTWEDYWKKVRNMDAPKLLLANEPAIKEFFRYNAETVKRNGIENLWTVAFRGKADQPFWSVFEDAPKGDKERAEVINKMLRIQFETIKEVTGNPKPFARITFYDEIADLMSKGYLKPPEGENMIWTYVAARRDPYPYDDLVNFNSGKPVKLGYYMNFGFASTGAHVAPAEGPWKMEFNYRYINNKSPLFFSVVNVGNMREFVLELSANAKMLWDYNSYNSDEFMIDYCTQYFGAEHAKEIAQLYKDYYNSYWQPKASEFDGMERQFLFQDLRYARAFDHIYNVFYSSTEKINMNPLHKIGYESVPGRTFRIDCEYNNSKNQVDAILFGMGKTIPQFESVAERCSKMMLQLDADKRTFFNDNLRIYSYYMSNLSKTLYHYVYAYKNQAKRDILIKNLELANAEAIKAKHYLYEGQHGIFSTWYSNADPLARTFQIDSLIKNITALKQQAINSK